MIHIKIQDKSYRIKSISELTTKEFIELSKLPELNFVTYIAWQTGLNTDSAFFAVTSAAVEKAIGKIPDVTKLPLPKWPDYKKLIETVGQRHQIESCKLEGYELVVFILAVSQARSNNSDEVEKKRLEYLNLPFAEVLPAGFFFLKILNGGRKYALKSFVKRLFSTKIKK